MGETIGRNAPPALAVSAGARRFESALWRSLAFEHFEGVSLLTWVERFHRDPALGGPQGLRRRVELWQRIAQAMAAAQGMEFDRSLKSSPLIEAQFAAIRERVAYLEQDRYLAPDIEAMRAWAQQSAWPAALTQCLPSFA